MLSSLSPFFIDCQSTGSSPKESELLELAWNDRSWVLRTEMPVSAKICKLIGITNEEVQSGSSSEDVWRNLALDVERQGCSETLAVAHFSRFEKIYLDRLWTRHAGIHFPMRLVCTHRMAKLLFPKLPSYGLRALAGWFGAPLDFGKRASNHVEATRVIWKALVTELQARGINTIEELLEFCDQKPKRNMGRREFLIPREKRLGIPDCPGIYRFLDQKGRILYVGKATSLKQRVNSYFTGGCRGDHRKLEMLAQAVDLKFEVLETPLQSGLREYDEIRALNPPYNIAFTGAPKNPINQLNLLAGPLFGRDFAKDLDLIRDVFYGADDVEIIKDGIQKWRRSLSLDDHEDLSKRFLLNLGMPSLREWIHEERERRAAADLVSLDAPELDGGVANDEGGEEVSSGDDVEAAEFVWEAELVADYCTRILRRAARHHIRLKWLRRISMATITYVSAGKHRRSSGPRNALKDSSPEISRLIIPSQSLFDEQDPRRERLLISELRRNEAKGGVWQVVKPWPMTVPFWI